MNFKEMYSIVKNVKNIQRYDFKFLTMVKVAHELNIPYSSEWCNEFDKNYRVSPNVKDQKAFEDCVKGELYTTDTDIILLVTIYNGDSMSGERLKPLCTYKLPITSDNFKALTTNPKTFKYKYNVVENTIVRELQSMAKYEVERQEIIKREKLIQKTYEKLIATYTA